MAGVLLDPTSDPGSADTDCTSGLPSLLSEQVTEALTAGLPSKFCGLTELETVRVASVVGLCVGLSGPTPAESVSVHVSVGIRVPSSSAQLGLSSSTDIVRCRAAENPWGLRTEEQQHKLSICHKKAFGQRWRQRDLL